jgi:hypothetical protein
MPVTLPTKTDGTQAYSVTVPLEGVNFGFTFSWNARGQYWSAILSDAAGNPLIRRVIRVGLLFFARFRAQYLSVFPPGEIVVIDTTGADLDPGLTELGTRVQLVYFTGAEISQAAADAAAAT